MWSTRELTRYALQAAADDSLSEGVAYFVIAVFVCSLAAWGFRALFMWVIWVSEVTLFVGHRLLHGRIGVANYPYLSKKQPMRY